MLNLINKIYSILLIIIFILCVFFFPFLYSNQDKTYITSSYVSSKYDLYWPIPNYTYISSYFGRRVSPTSGASSYHSGLDIPAPEGTPLYASDDGEITFASWGAGGGYTIVIKSTSHDNLSFSYCHVSPIMYIRLHDKVLKGEMIGSVGPKNVYGINDNPYKDSNGNPTNGATTGCHLHFTIKENGNAVNPLNYYDLSDN